MFAPVVKGLHQAKGFVGIVRGAPTVVAGKNGVIVAGTAREGVKTIQTVHKGKAVPLIDMGLKNKTLPERAAMGWGAMSTAGKATVAGAGAAGAIGTVGLVDGIFGDVDPAIGELAQTPYGGTPYQGAYGAYA